MIRSAVEITGFVRTLNPELPIIFGGWHSSLLPAQTLAHEGVDILVRGQGEESILDLAIHLREGKSVETVRGISFKSGGKVVQNADRPVQNVNNLPSPAFSLGNFDAYEKRTGLRKLP